MRTDERREKQTGRKQKRAGDHQRKLAETLNHLSDQPALNSRGNNSHESEYPPAMPGVVTQAEQHKKRKHRRHDRKGDNR